MLARESIYGRTKLTYVLSDPKPEILIISGFHGDEIDVVTHVTQYIEAHFHALPPFLYVPIASPSAAARHTRYNEHNVDINRSYYFQSPEEEAQALMNLLAPYSFTTIHAFHEDPELTSFYLYDYGDRTDMNKFDELKKKLLSERIVLFTGVDDPSDTSLGNVIFNGYIGWDMSADETTIEYGFFQEYTFATGKCRRHYTYEVPGRLPKERKSVVVSSIMSTMMK